MLKFITYQVILIHESVLNEQAWFVNTESVDNVLKPWTNFRQLGNKKSGYNSWVIGFCSILKNNQVIVDFRMNVTT